MTIPLIDCSPGGKYRRRFREHECQERLASGKYEDCLKCNGKYAIPYVLEADEKQCPACGLILCRWERKCGCGSRA